LAPAYGEEKAFELTKGIDQGKENFSINKPRAEGDDNRRGKSELASI
jgi:hypothetical protein